jgi:hypothetical protein
MHLEVLLFAAAARMPHRHCMLRVAAGISVVSHKLAALLTHAKAATTAGCGTAAAPTRWRPQQQQQVVSTAFFPTTTNGSQLQRTTSWRLHAIHPCAPASSTVLLPPLLLLLPGRGAYGSVYKALDRSSGQIVAIKVISTTDSDEDDLTRIHKEVRSAARLAT